MTTGQHALRANHTGTENRRLIGPETKPWLIFDSADVRMRPEGVVPEQKARQIPSFALVSASSLSDAAAGIGADVRADACLFRR